MYTIDSGQINSSSAVAYPFLHLLTFFPPH